jgi:phage shock protein PspC (stress-responsive transcriptional regulator)
VKRASDAAYRRLGEETIRAGRASGAFCAAAPVEDAAQQILAIVDGFGAQLAMPHTGEDDDRYAGLAPRAARRLLRIGPGHPPALPWPHPEIRARTVRSAGPPGRVESMAAPLVRPRDRVIAGVCAGLARRFGLSPTTVRVLFVLSCLLPGPQFVLYLVLWVLLPDEQRWA